MQIRRARQLRRESTPAEALLWRLLRNRHLAGHKFRRQQPIGPYIADFCCLSARLIIELDGGQHAERTLEDQRRTQWLLGEGYRLVRFWNHEVFCNPEGVWQQVGQLLDPSLEAEAASPHPASPPRGEEPIEADTTSQYTVE